MNFDKLIGKQVAGVALLKDGEYFRLSFTDGTDATYGVEGDCSSSSWIEHLEQPADLAGATLLSVEDTDGVAWDGHDCSNAKCGHDFLAVYNTTFRTNRGDIVLEYRNDSNSYYGGYLVEASEVG